MITITITMKVRSAKRRELLQTLDELTEEMRREHGFLDARIGMNGEKDNKLTFIEEWDTEDDMNAYVQSPYFRVLKGALKVLTTSAAIEFSDA
jgi:quinol monooxygenase YgiN